MTIFSDNPHDRRMERLMMTVPNFAPRGVGFRFTEAQLFITTTAATPTEILTATMRQIRCPPFRKRFNEYIESEEKPMTYINEKHRARFELAAKNILKANYASLSALYLLTADQRLWSCCKHHILYDQYGSMDEVISAVRQMTQDAGPVKAVFFCPLVGNIDEGDGDMCPTVSARE